MEDLLISLLEGAALAHLDRCAIGRDLDAGFDAGPARPRPGEREADDLLHATGFWYEAELENWCETRYGEG